MNSSLTDDSRDSIISIPRGLPHSNSSSRLLSSCNDSMTSGFSMLNPINLISSAYQMFRGALAACVFIMSAFVCGYGFIENNLFMAIGALITIAFCVLSFGELHSARLIKQQVDAFAFENKLLTGNVKRLDIEIGKLETENRSMIANIEELNRQNVRFINTNISLNMNIDRMRAENSELVKVRQAFELQIVSLRQAHEESKKFIKVLVEAGDSYSKFSKTYGEQAEKLTTLNTGLEQTSADLEKTNADLKQTAELFKKMANGLTEHRERQLWRAKNGLPPKVKRIEYDSDE